MLEALRFMLSTTAEVRTERTPLLPLTLLCIGVSTLYILSMLAVTDSHFVPQVSDLYLIAQYARGFAEGHPFQYNPGETATTGATSLLHTLFLAIAHFIGFRGEGLIAFAIFTGAIFGLLTAIQAHGAGQLVSGSSRIARFGAILVILNGPLAWSFHYGADIALVLFLATWLFRAWLLDQDPEDGLSRGFVLPASLLALTRPEAAAFVAILAAWKVWDWRRRTGKWKVRAIWFLPALLALLVPLVFRILTGSAANTSFSHKLLSANWGAFSAAVLSIEYWTDLLRGILLGFYPASQRLGLGGGNAPYFAAPFLLVFVFIALLRPTREMKRAGAFLTAALATVLLVTPSIHMGVHSNRYLLFTLPPLLVLFAAGVGHAAASLDAALGLQAGAAFQRLRAIALVFAALSVGRFALVYADSANSVYRKDEAIFTFIQTRMPEGVTFLNNGTAIEYRTGRRSVNLSGVVSPGFAQILPAETEAASFDLLSRQGFGALPPYFIAFDAYVASSPVGTALVGGPPIFVTSSLESAELAIYPTRTDLVGRQRHLIRLDLPPDLKLVDSLNVTDPLDEKDHRYGWYSAVGTRSLFAALKVDKYTGPGRGEGTEIADGGRLIMGYEEMEVNTPSRTEDLWIVVRTHPEPSVRLRHPEGERRLDLSLPQGAARVTTRLGRTEWFKTPLQPGWNEIAYRIPAALLDTPRTRLRIDGQYAAYWYGFFQRN
jgi:hypothetical protein